MTSHDRIGTVLVDLVDGSRADPLGGTAGPRRFTAQLWFPVQAGTAHAGPAALASPGVAALSAVRLDTDPQDLAASTGGAVAADITAIVPGPHPLVTYSPGRGDPGWTATTICEDLAAHGCLVVALGHTHDSPVQFRDGTVVPTPGDIRDVSKLELLCSVRADDLEFVIAELTGSSATGALSDLRAQVDPGAVAAFGHSLGGAASAELARRGMPVASVVDLDGRPMSAVVADGLGVPFLLLSALREDNAEMDKLRAGQRVPGAWLKMPGTGHYSFVEAAVRAREWHLADRWDTERYQAYFGSADPAATAAATTTIVRDHVLGALAGRPRLPGPEAGLVVGWSV